jgi:hypothetical protein
VLASILIIYFGFFLGFIGRKLNLFKPAFTEMLFEYVINIALPFLILHLVTLHFRFAPNYLMFFFTCIALFLILHGLVSALGIVFKFSKEFIKVLHVIIPYTNAGLLGIPVLVMLLDDMAGVFASIYICALAMTRATMCSIISARSKVSMKNTCYRICTFPPFIAMCIAIAINITSIQSGFLLDIFKFFGKSTAPVVFIAFGTKLSELSLREIVDVKWLLICLAILKLIITPIIGLLVGILSGIEQYLIKVILIETAMSPAISNQAILNYFKIESKFSTIFIIITTVAAPFTATILFYTLFS